MAQSTFHCIAGSLFLLAAGACGWGGGADVDQTVVRPAGPSSSASAQPAPDPPHAAQPGRGWPMFRGGPEHRGTNDGAPSSAPELLWSVHLDKASGVSPVTSGDGRIYVPTLAGLVALDEAGATKWVFPPDPASWMTAGRVALFGDDRILLLDVPAGSLTVLDRDGKVVANTKNKAWTTAVSGSRENGA